MVYRHIQGPLLGGVFLHPWRASIDVFYRFRYLGWETFHQTLDHTPMHTHIHSYAYTSEAMGSNMVDIKAYEPNDGSRACLTRCWANESHETTVRIKKFDRGTTAAYLLGWLLQGRIRTLLLKDYHDSYSNLLPKLNRSSRRLKRGAPCWCWNSVTVFEKSPTELKIKQKLLRYKSTIQIVTLNVRTFNRIGKVADLTPSTTDHNIFIICIQEQQIHS